MVEAVSGSAGPAGTGDPVATQGPAGAPERIIAGFARALRVAGIAVPTGSAVMYAEALGQVGVEDPGRVYWAGRSTLIRRPEDADLYDRVFTSYWAEVTALGLTPAWSEPVTLAVDSDQGDDQDPGDPGAGPSGGEIHALRWSAAEILADRDLAALDADEWAEAQRLVSALQVSTDLRPSRRRRPSRQRSGVHPDLRGTMRRNMRHGGVPISRAWRTPVQRSRRMVFLLDVSGSMEAYSRAMVRFAHAAVSSRRTGRVEVFTLGTRLTRITRELARRDPESALRSAGRSVADWSGGTRLGESIRAFNDHWGIRGMARGAVVVICSDGWDRGDPEQMAAEMARLARVAYRLVWVNPLKASPGYAPLARGMAAALPYVDQFVEGHSVTSLEHLADIISGTVR
ncbi:MAG TPA: VWA domain-containing protein [Acidimicrobiales bacterium]|nr:VWA domain-containing protein [Acidimicrobiales bacterium]